MASNTKQQEPRVVQVVGNYLVGPTVGKGYFAKVKRVEDPYKQTYAMKCFDKERISRSAHSLRQVEKEINALRLCNHPNIVKFHEVLEVENSVYLIMEYVPHGELFDYIKNKGRLSEPEACFLARQIAMALSYCHKAGIAHRDVKPENILIDEYTNVKLVDFGLSSFYSNSDYTGAESTPLHESIVTSDEAGYQVPESQQTQLQTQCGSPHYAAPEVLLGLGYHGPTADIWSFGVLLYAMVTGSLPFTARVIPQLVQKIVAGVYRMPSFLSPFCKHLLSGILRTNPRDRLSMQDILNHPWFNKTESWTPPVTAPITPPIGTGSSSSGTSSGNGQQALLVLSQAAKLQRQQRQQESTCVKCGKSMQARIGLNGMIVLGSSNNNNSSSSSSDNVDLCQCNQTVYHHTTGTTTTATTTTDKQHLMQMPKLFTKKSKPSSKTKVSPDFADVDSVAEEDEDDVEVECVLDSVIKAVTCWRPQSIDVSTAVASDREFALMMACERGDIEKVRQIIYDSEPCPLIINKLKQVGGSAIETPESGRSSSGSNMIGLCCSTPNENVYEQHTNDLEDDENFEDDFTQGDWRLRGTCLCENQPHRLDLRVHGMDNWTALHYAARGGFAHIADELILSCLPLDVNAVTKNGWTPLMFAADKGHADVVELLLRYRADIHVTSKNGKTAIFLARERNFTTISQRLTEISSVRHLQNLQHNTLVESIARNTVAAQLQNAKNNQQIASPVSTDANYVKALKVATAMRAAWFSSSSLQAELTEACESGDLAKIKLVYPLSVQSLEKDDYDTIQSSTTTTTFNNISYPLPASLTVPPLSSAQVDFYAKGIDNWSLLHYAARKDRHDVVLTILELLVSSISPSRILTLVNAVTKSGWTPLMLACDRGHITTVKLLVQCGADIAVKSNSGEDCLSIVNMYQGQPKYAQILAFLQEQTA